MKTTAYPPSIIEYGQIRKTNKADFLSCFAGHGATLLTCLDVTAKVIDGAKSKTSGIQNVCKYIEYQKFLWDLI